MHHDRRRHPRRPAQRLVKLRCEDGALRYRTARTCDLSAGGALLELSGPAPLTAGQRLTLGIADPRAPAVLRRERMIRATIVRRESTAGGSPRLAVRFDAPAADAIAA